MRLTSVNVLRRAMAYGRAGWSLAEVRKFAPLTDDVIDAYEEGVRQREQDRSDLAIMRAARSPERWDQLKRRLVGDLYGRNQS